MKITALFLSILLCAAAAVPGWIYYRGAETLKLKHELLRQEAAVLAQLSAENERLMKQASSPELSDAELSELLKLRNEIGQLRHMIKAMQNFRRELDRARAALERLKKDAERGEPPAATLVTDEIEQQTRRERATLLREFMAENNQTSPEMKLLPEAYLNNVMLWTPVTQGDFEGYSSTVRLQGELLFTGQVRNALKAYAEANQNGFPSDVAALKPFFKSPMDDDILAQYHVVRADTLIPQLARDQGEWVITRRAPVNKNRDTRTAVGKTFQMANYTKFPDRWDPRAP